MSCHYESEFISGLGTRSLPIWERADTEVGSAVPGRGQPPYTLVPKSTAATVEFNKKTAYRFLLPTCSLPGTVVDTVRGYQYIPSLPVHY